MATYDETLLQAVERAAALLDVGGPLDIGAIADEVFDEGWFFAAVSNPIQSLAQRMRHDGRCAYDRATHEWRHRGVSTMDDERRRLADADERPARAAREAAHTAMVEAGRRRRDTALAHAEIERDAATAELAALRAAVARLELASAAAAAELVAVEAERDAARAALGAYADPDQWDGLGLIWWGPDCLHGWDPAREALGLPPRRAWVGDEAWMREARRAPTERRP